jgi:hypothetical protein
MRVQPDWGLDRLIDCDADPFADIDTDDELTKDEIDELLERELPEREQEISPRSADRPPTADEQADEALEARQTAAGDALDGNQPNALAQLRLEPDDDQPRRGAR